MPKIQTAVSLLPYNTFRIDVQSRYFTEIQTLTEIQELRETPEFQQNEKLILGGGSNILFTKNFDGLVIKNSLKGIELLYEDADFYYVKSGAGEVWNDLVLWCIQHDYAGLENLSLIPGQVGASPMQNIGAYGVEIKDVCEKVEAVHLQTGETLQFCNADCQFGYRESIFKHELKNQCLITAVTYKLRKTPQFHIDYGDIKNTLAEMMVSELSIKAVSDAVIKIRSSKLPDPAVLGNAGSFFKNPVISHEKTSELLAKNPVMPNYPQADGVKIPAGWLIEQCGWKGKVVGNTGSHKSQALVLVNYGNATGKEIYNLAMEIQHSVQEKFGITISPEVNLV